MIALALNDKRLHVHYLISGAQEGSNGYWCKASESAHESERADWQANRRRPICMMSVSQTYTAVVLAAFSVGINVPRARNTLHSSTEYDVINSADSLQLVIYELIARPRQRNVHATSVSRLPVCQWHCPSLTGAKRRRRDT